MTNFLGLSLHSILWFVLIGWCAGWVTGRTIKGSGHGAYGDAVLGTVGGLLGGWLMHTAGPHGNWLVLLSALASAMGAALLTWLLRRVIQRQTWHLDHPQHNRVHGRM